MRVAAYTGGKCISGARFRVRQYVPLLKQAGIELDEFYTPWGSWPPIAKALRPFWLLGTLAAWTPRILSSYRYDLSFFQRELISTLVTLEPFTKRPRIFDVDDAVWLNRGGRNGFGAVLEACEGVICGNRFIAENACRWNSNICLLPTAVDTDRYIPMAPGCSQDGRRIIGWSGLAVGLKYLYDIEQALVPVLNKHPDVHLRIVSERPPTFTYLRASQFQYIPWSPLNEVRTIQEMSVGLMPIPDSLWGRGKCSYKMLLYMACGIPVVVSPVGMNAELLSLNRIGFGPKNLSEWSAALDHLLQNPDEGSEMGKSGRRIVEEGYSLRVLTPRLVSFLRRIVG